MPCGGGCCTRRALWLRCRRPVHVTVTLSPLSACRNLRCCLCQTACHVHSRQVDLKELSTFTIQDLRASMWSMSSMRVQGGCRSWRGGPGRWRCMPRCWQRRDGSRKHTRLYRWVNQSVCQSWQPVYAHVWYPLKVTTGVHSGVNLCPKPAFCDLDSSNSYSLVL